MKLRDGSYPMQSLFLGISAKIYYNEVFLKMETHFADKVDKTWKLTNSFKKGVVRIWTKIGEYDK